jgi:hypothetical protein
MIPRFLFADDGESDREFVLHTQEPRILIEFVKASGEIVQWFDDQQDFINRSEHSGKEPSIELARVLREAGEFFAS